MKRMNFILFTDFDTMAGCQTRYFLCRKHIRMRIGHVPKLSILAPSKLQRSHISSCIGTAEVLKSPGHTPSHIPNEKCTSHTCYLLAPASDDLFLVDSAST